MLANGSIRGVDYVRGFGLKGTSPPAEISDDEVISFLLLNCDQVHTETGAVVQNHRNRILTRRWSGNHDDRCHRPTSTRRLTTSRRRLDWILHHPLSVDPAVVLAHREALANARHVLVIWLIQGAIEEAAAAEAADIETPV